MPQSLATWCRLIVSQRPCDSRHGSLSGGSATGMAFHRCWCEGICGLRWGPSRQRQGWWMSDSAVDEEWPNGEVERLLLYETVLKTKSLDLYPA